MTYTRKIVRWSNNAMRRIARVVTVAPAESRQASSLIEPALNKSSWEQAVRVPLLEEMSAWYIEDYYLKIGCTPRDARWAQAFEEVDRLADVLGLSRHEQAQLIIEKYQQLSSPAVDSAIDSNVFDTP